MKVMSSLVLALLLVVAVPMRADILEQVLVKVNGDIITKTDLEQRQIAALRQRNGGNLPEAELKKAIAEVTPQMLVDAIDELLLVQMGRDKGYHLSDSQFKEWLENLRKEQGLEDEAKFQAALKQEGMTLDDLRKNVERQFLISQVQREEVGSKLSITEEEAHQVLPDAPVGIHRAGERHAARNPRRRANDDPGRPGRRQRRPRRRREGEGRGDPRADCGRRGFRQGGVGSLGVVFEDKRRPDWPDQHRGPLARSWRSCSGG